MERILTSSVINNTLKMRIAKCCVLTAASQKELQQMHEMGGGISVSKIHEIGGGISISKIHEIGERISVSQMIDSTRDKWRNISIRNCLHFKR